MIAGAFAWLGTAISLVLFSAPGPALATPSDIARGRRRRRDRRRRQRPRRGAAPSAVSDSHRLRHAGVPGVRHRTSVSGARTTAGRITLRTPSRGARPILDWPAKALASIDRAALSPADRLNYDLFRRQVEERLEGRRFPWELMPVNQLGGIQQSVPQMLGEQMPASTEADYAAILSRLRGAPGAGRSDDRADEGRAPARRSHRRKSPCATFRLRPARSSSRIPRRARSSRPSGSMPASIPADRRDALKADAATVLTAQVVPAFRRFRDFLATEYVPHCRESLAATALPDGQAWYALCGRLLDDHAADAEADSRDRPRRGQDDPRRDGAGRALHWLRP